MPVKSLPANPSLNHLKYQARDLLRMHAGRDVRAAQRIRELHPRFNRASDTEIFDTELSLSDAQLAISREYGFPNWGRLKKRIEKPTVADDVTLPHHERIEDATFRRAVGLLDAGNEVALTAYLHEHPDVVHQRVLFEGGNYFRNPTLLEFVAENPVRHGTLPANIVRIAKLVLETGAKEDPVALNETLGLVCSGRVARECHAQVPLIDVLCDYGADPQQAISAALVQAEFEAVHALIRRGAQVDLPVAAAMGFIEDARRLLATADTECRHGALALASQFGHTEIVRLLLDSGEDPNRYNPVGFHSHSTPLHQAALAGHEETVTLLVERGAALDARDTLWHGTPADWARYGKSMNVEEYLLAQEKRGTHRGARDP